VPAKGNEDRLKKEKAMKYLFGFGVTLATLMLTTSSAEAGRRRWCCCPSGGTVMMMPSSSTGAPQAATTTTPGRSSYSSAYQAPGGEAPAVISAPIRYRSPARISSRSITGQMEANRARLKGGF
jgi:hypothetical protein